MSKSKTGRRPRPSERYSQPGGRRRGYDRLDLDQVSATYQIIMETFAAAVESEGHDCAVVESPAVKTLYVGAKFGPLTSMGIVLLPGPMTHYWITHTVPPPLDDQGAELIRRHLPGLPVLVEDNPELGPYAYRVRRITVPAEQPTGPLGALVVATSRLINGKRVVI